MNLEAEEKERETGTGAQGTGEGEQNSGAVERVANPGEESVEVEELSVCGG